MEKREGKREEEREKGKRGGKRGGKREGGKREGEERKREGESYILFRVQKGHIYQNNKLKLSLMSMPLFSVIP